MLTELGEQIVVKATLYTLLDTEQEGTGLRNEGESGLRSDPADPLNRKLLSKKIGAICPDTGT